MTTPIPHHPRHGYNSHRFVHGDETPCAICGKGIRPDRQRYFVRVAYGSELAYPDEPVDAAADCGYLPIGDDCRRRYPAIAAYVTTSKE